MRFFRKVYAVFPFFIGKCVHGDSSDKKIKPVYNRSEKNLRVSASVNKGVEWE